MSDVKEEKKKIVVVKKFNAVAFSKTSKDVLLYLILRP